MPPYREVTFPAVLLGIVFGIVLSACFTYAGLLIGFTVGGSAIAAILGFGVLRGILGRCTIVENNINQTVASGINITTAGLIFTVPAFYLMDVPFNPVLIALGGIAGAMLGVLFIIPIRKQMIDVDRLRFPSATAVAAVLKSPGAGVVKARLLVGGLILSAGFQLLVEFPRLTTLLFQSTVPGTFDLGHWIGLPGYVENVWALSLFSLGAGFITGRPGLVVLAGGILAYWLVTPVAVSAGWVPTKLDPGTLLDPTTLEGGKVISRWVHDQINRPIGIGMLVGGALTGIALALPSIAAALKTLRRVELGGDGADELPINFLYAGIVAAFALLFAATYLTMEDGTLLRAFLVALVGTAWIGLAGIIVAQATGMTDWSPISGLALIAIVLGLVLSNHSIATAILVGAAVCVAIGECADMMSDLKTGYLVGAKPIRQQVAELSTVAIGPIVCLAVIAILWRNPGFGPGKDLTAPQAQAVQATIKAVEEGQVPWPKYVGGCLTGALLGLSGIPGIGVLVGLSMYLPLAYILPYGAGCLVQMTALKLRGAGWAEERGVPFAAGLLVGEPLIVLVKSILVMSGGVAPSQ